MKKTFSLKEMLEKNQERFNLRWKIKDNNIMFQHNGLWYDESFVEQMFPKWEYTKMRKGENPSSKVFA